MKLRMFVLLVVLLIASPVQAGRGHSSGVWCNATPFMGPLGCEECDPTYVGEYIAEGSCAESLFTVRSLVMPNPSLGNY
jgi:hypothetical protein